VGEEFLTVKEFAELAGVSVQSVYKKLGKSNNPIQRYLKVVDGVKYISRTALDVLYASGPAPRAEEREQSILDDEPQQMKNSTDRLLDILEQQLEEQRRQIQEKDIQIAAQNEQIKSLLARLEESSKIIDQQQKLTAMNTKALLETEKKEEAVEQVVVEEETIKEADNKVDIKPLSARQRFFRWLLGEI